MKTIEMMEQRINILSQRDPVANANIIRKIRRAIRKAQAQVNQEQ